MDDIIKQQLNNIKSKTYIIDGTTMPCIPEEFNEIIFPKENKEKEVKVIFEDYFIKKTNGFDFNEKFNAGIFPFSKIMHGVIIDQTEKMYKFRLHTETSCDTWVGWCPKKCCAVIQ